MQDMVGDDGDARFQSFRDLASSQVVIPANAGIQYAAASRFDHRRLWNTGSPGPVSAKASPGPQLRSAAEALAKAASRATTSRGIPAAHCVRALPISSAQRGRGECRAHDAPAASRAKLMEAHERSHHRSVRFTRHSRTQWFLRFPPRSPRRRIRFCHRRLQIDGLAEPG